MPLCAGTVAADPDTVLVESRRCDWSYGLFAGDMDQAAEQSHSYFCICCIKALSVVTSRIGPVCLAGGAGIAVGSISTIVNPHKASE